MKKVLIYILSFFFICHSFGQTLSGYRYWFDDQFSNAQNITGGFGNNYFLQQNFTVSQLSDGLHTFNIAFKESSNVWSSTSSTFFYKQTVNVGTGPAQYQYWYDNDFYNAYTNFITSTNNLYLVTDLDVNNLSNGLHSLNMRFRPDGGSWSVVTTSLFYKMSGTMNSNLTRYQYWFDNKIQDSITENLTLVSNLSLATSINTSSLSIGLHVFNVRFKQDNGLWSVVKSDFFINNDITQTNSSIKTYKYWFDNNSNQSGQISIGQTPGGSFISNLDVESLTNGLHTVSSMFKDANGLWSSPITSFFNRGDILRKEYVYPKIYLSKSTISAGQKDTITGKDFVPNGEVQLTISLTSTTTPLVDTIIGANVEGKISFEFVTVTTTLPGIYGITAYDVNNSQTAYPARIEVKPISSQPPKYISINTPENGKAFSQGEVVKVSWDDKLLADQALISNTASRAFKYKLEYSLNNGAWNLCPDRGSYTNGELNGRYFVNQNPDNKLNYEFVTNQIGFYRIRITDLFNAANNAISNSFEIKSFTQQMTVDLLWDNSCPDVLGTPIGVSADGVARLIVKVSKVNNVKDIATISLKLEDNLNSSGTRLLGKLKLCTNILNYTTEANDANLTLLPTSQTIDQTRKSFYFWYVAPDDFSRGQNDYYSGSRDIKILITVNYTDNSVVQFYSNKNIEVVRPPLMLVHGLAGEPSSWKYFDFDLDATGAALWAPVARNYFKAGVRTPDMYESGCYKQNACELLNLTFSGCNNNGNEVWNTGIPGYVNKNSFAYMLQTARKNKYAANRVDYVCHSMGGDMARTAINLFPEFYSPVASNTSCPYKNYDRGFINKLITINTPFNGSPIADLGYDLSLFSKSILEVRTALEDLGKLDPMFNAFFLNKTVEPNTGRQYIPIAPAIKDLQSQSGGIIFKETYVKNHLIYGQVQVSDLAAYLICFAANRDYIQKKMGPFITLVMNHPSFNPKKSFCDNLSSIFSNYGEPGFFGNSDLVVPVNSQIANRGLASSSVKRFTGLEARHTYTLESNRSIISNREVSRHVQFILNQSMESPYFADKLLANPNVDGIQYRTLSTDSVIQSIDSIKIKIVSAPSTLSLDSLIDVRINLKDSTGLKFIRVAFQGQLYFSNSTISDQRFNIQISPALPGRNLLIASAVYDSVGYQIIHSDTTTVNCNIETTLTKFFIEPKERYLNKDQVNIPQYSAVHTNYIINVPYTDSSLHIFIADTNVVKFIDSLKRFKAVSDTGSTFSIITYKGFKDTIYYFIGDLDNDMAITNSPICPGGSKQFTSGIVSANSAIRQWQVDAGTGFTNITNDSVFSGATSDTLRITNPPTSWYGYKYRCIVSDGNSFITSETFQLKFAQAWKGSTSTAWENSANWDCGILPDENTDVIINSAPFYPTVNTNVSCRSLTLNPTVTITLSAGHTLNIKGKNN